MLGDDVVENLVSMLRSMGVNSSDKDGVTFFETKPMEGGHPWRYVRQGKNHCTLWKSILYETLCMRLLPEDQWFVPIGCQGCYKVVVRPRTYKELMELLELMESMDVPCKCGVETRNTVKGLYGGYFYCRGLAEGKERYEQVRALVDPEIPVFLKRGCTKFELNHGPSDKWEITPEQRKIENEVLNRLQVSVCKMNQSERDIERVLELWKNFAWKLDPTYDGEEVFPKCVTYN